MPKKLAGLFPAFAMKYREFHRNGPERFRDAADEYLRRASAVVEVDPRKFERRGGYLLDDSLEDDLQEHYVSYIDSCALGSLLTDRGIACDYVAGYSMGLFAAMSHSGAVTFEDGLELLQATCRFAHEAVEEDRYGMGVVVGFTPDELGSLIADHCPGVEVADVSGPRVVISSGPRDDLERLLQAAEAGGSLQARFLPVGLPFHSARLREVEWRIRDILGRLPIAPPRCGIVSCVGQEILVTRDDVLEEVARNVWQPIRWHATMRRLLSLEVDTFVECGPSESLCNLARNLDGEFRAYHPRKFVQLFASRA
jgi:[acyl-carrier-protein] S-malonyltransferase